MSLLKQAKLRNSHKKGNVMTPLNWMFGIFELILFPTAATNRDNWLGICSFILAVILIAFYCASYIYFAMKDPNRLQTEEFNLEAMQISFQASGPPQIASHGKTELASANQASELPLWKNIPPK